MSMKKKRKLLDLSVILVFLPVALALTAKTSQMYYICVVAAIVLALAWVVAVRKIWRCPYCDAYLGRTSKISHCPHCGKELDADGGR